MMVIVIVLIGIITINTLAIIKLKNRIDTMSNAIEYILEWIVMHDSNNKRNH
jgi:hypothetical protein